jgi:hypothetical protein
MSKIEVDAIDKQSGSTLTLGGSGTAVTLACGATQSGFGRNGSVNWQTTIKTGDFTAVSGEGYFINTTSGPITMTLPASPSVGDIVAFKDYAGTFDNNNLTINRNGSNIVGGTTNPTISVEGQAGTLVYGDATQGWQIVEAATDADLPRPSFITATGGTITTVCTNFKVHTFTGPGTFCVSSAGNAAGSNSVDYVVIAGGGSGGHGCSGGGAGGAGGYRESPGTTTCYTASPLGASPATAITVTATGFPITVGGGGAAVSNPNIGNQGASSTFSTITSAGGGAGGRWSVNTAGAGGSGGGSAGPPTTPGGSNGGAGNTPSVNPPQGQNGGNLGYWQMAGGGGAGGAGTPGHSPCGTCGGSNTNRNGKGGGGAGVTSSINGTPTARAGGGGGGFSSQPSLSPASDFAPGGTGGGGAGGPGPSPAMNGTDNTGGGGGGSPQPNPGNSGAGGSGIVIIRYKFQ